MDIRGGGKEWELKEEEMRERNRSTSTGSLEQWLNKEKKKKREIGGQEGKEEDSQDIEWKKEMLDILKNVKEELQGMKEVKEIGKSIKREMEELKMEIREKEERWKGEREDLKENIKKLEKRLKDIELDQDEGEERGKGR